ncbi:DUF2933 domain-containing protein [Castellaniella sp. FW104-16D08]|uniref:DUF2933 domain-containing protein n=1 Tax=unclassified Castellaniella TaxID=2617606 RepID=UPI0033156D4E
MAENWPCPDRRPNKGHFWLAVGSALTAAVFLLWEEHQVPLLGALPWVILLAGCLLMHVFLQGGRLRPRPDRDHKVAHKDVRDP